MQYITAARVNGTEFALRVESNKHKTKVVPAWQMLVTAHPTSVKPENTM